MNTKTAESSWTLGGMCVRAERRPASPFGRLMRRHRTWCPAWNAHTKVHGPKPFATSRRKER